jgi:hypothetical protein
MQNLRPRTANKNNKRTSQSGLPLVVPTKRKHVQKNLLISPEEAKVARKKSSVRITGL